MISNSDSVDAGHGGPTAEVGRRSAGGGVRATRQRGAIIALLETLDGFRSAQELHDELRHSGANIGLTTVYRTLQSLAAADLVDMVRTDTGESVSRVSIRRWLDRNGSSVMKSGSLASCSTASTGRLKSRV